MESIGPEKFVKKDEKRTNAVARQMQMAAARWIQLSGAARMGSPLASSHRFQIWLNKRAGAAAAIVITNVSLVAYISPSPKPASRAHLNLRERQYRPAQPRRW